MTVINSEILHRQIFYLLIDCSVYHDDLSFQESSSEDDLDDEAMMKLDDALAAVFKTQLQAKNNKNKKKGEVVYSCVSEQFGYTGNIHLRL